jgi:hypothetical protein
MTDMERTDFLTQREFQDIYNHLPEDSWEKAKVYNPHHKISRTNDSVRISEKNYEKRDSVVRDIKRIILPKLIGWMRADIENFQHCWLRTRHVEWMRYHEGDFFKPHRDFEKYTCNGMTPFVFILGLNDVEEGGETRVEKKVLSGSAKRNGGILFQSNLMHESIMVQKGMKLCLKLELFVFIEKTDNVFRVHGPNMKWMSLWPKAGLRLLENYIHNSSDFHKTKSDIEFSESTSRDIHNLSLIICDPKSSLPVDVDFYFPGYSKYSLHEIFAFAHFAGSDQKFFYGTDHHAWEFINTGLELDPSIQLFVCLWIRNGDSIRDYFIESIYNRDGKCVYKDLFYQVFFIKETNEYAKLPDIKKSMLLRFMKRFDAHIDVHNDPDIPKYPTKGVQKEIRINPSMPPPSDIKHRPMYREGTETFTEREWCNDEDSGYQTFTYHEYRQYDIQIRYVAIKSA